MVYFAFHLVQGDRGFFSWVRLNQETEDVRLKLENIRAERQELEKKVAALRPESLDLDMLEERSREMLGVAHKDEIVIYYDQ